MDTGVNMTLVDFGIIGAAERRDGYVRSVESTSKVHFI